MNAWDLPPYEDAANNSNVNLRSKIGSGGGLVWSVLMKPADWGTRSFFSSCEFNNTIIVTGGSFTVRLQHGDMMVYMNDVWRSNDGSTWEAVTANADYSGRDSAGLVEFQNKLFLVGGNRDQDGNGEESSEVEQLNDVWSSVDGGESWSLVTAKAEFSPRDTTSLIVFKNNLWLFGGLSGTTTMNDIWSSADGKSWVKTVNDAPWAPRHFHSVVEFNNVLYLTCGERIDHGYQIVFNDIWKSEDGLKWSLLKEHTSFPPRAFQNVVVFNSELFLLGGGLFEESGTSSPVSHVFDDFYTSLDGINWTSYRKAPWSARDGMSAVILRDAMFLMGGQTGTVALDQIWMLCPPTSKFFDNGSSSSGDNSNDKAKSEEYFLLAIIGLFAVVSGLVLSVMYFKRKKRDGEYAKLLQTLTPILSPSQCVVTNGSRGSNCSEFQTVPKKWWIDMKNVSLERQIGSGATAVVFEGSFGSQKVAVKEFHIGRRYDRHVVNSIFKEVILLSELHHPNLIRLFGVSAHTDYIYLITELCDHSLRDIIDQPHFPLTVKSALRLILQIAHGVEFLHSRQMIHRDLKPSNVLLSGSHPAEAIAKICDLGLARHISPKDTTLTGDLGTPCFCSPEVMKCSTSQYTQAADSFSFGIMIWTIMARDMPYREHRHLGVLGLLNRIQNGLRPQMPAYSPLKLTKLTEQCWLSDPSGRPTFSTIVKTLQQILDSNIREFDIV
eukprot:TRINITY_DN777818_c0_g1_i1.p1 TRINITY_DN777818_c0_g1~~TRINITY_DN777818_c0_g1_i1.p1  ORF type:complete len:721 (+),score=148.07 TRINITY_DN777818_c0_g1_i1:133-2295(+)